MKVIRVFIVDFVQTLKNCPKIFLLTLSNFQRATFFRYEIIRRPVEKMNLLKQKQPPEVFYEEKRCPDKNL